MKLLEHLESIESFEAFLAEVAGDPELRRLRERAEQGPHYSEETLRQYASDALDEPTAGRVAEHVSLCRPCSQSVLDLRAASEHPATEAEDAPRMWEPPGVEEILESVGSFKNFLEDAAGSEAFQIMKSEMRRRAPLPLTTIVRYVMDDLDDDLAYVVMERVALDEQAAREVMWLYDKRDAVKDLVGWFGGLRRRIEDAAAAVLTVEPPTAFALAGPEPAEPAISGPLGLFCYGFMSSENLVSGEKRARGAGKSQTAPGLTIKPVDPRPYRPGETVEFEVRTERAGYLYVLRFSDDGEEPPEWVCPNDNRRNPVVRDGETVTLKLTAEEPVGRHFLKAVITQERLMDASDLDFRNRFEAQDALDKFLSALARLPDKQREIAQLQYIVSTQA